MLIMTFCFGLLMIAFCSFAQTLGQQLGVIDHPDGGRKRHSRPTPLVGGIALMVPLIPVLVHEAILRPSVAELLTVLGLAGFAFMMLGLFDDRHHVSPGGRLLVSAILCGFLLVIEPGLRLTALEFGSYVVPLSVLALPFTVLCLVGLKNAINMTDGLNGLLIGLAIFWCICLLMYASANMIPYLSMFLLGLLILLPYNLAGRLFLGDAGSYTIGISVGLLMIHTYREAAGALPMMTVVLWLSIPVIDCLRVMGMRLLTRRSLADADTNHLHHWLSQRWRWPMSLMVYFGIVVPPGLIAAIWPDQTMPMLAVALSTYASVLWSSRPRQQPLEAAARSS